MQGGQGVGWSGVRLVRGQGGQGAGGPGFRVSRVVRVQGVGWAMIGV